ncbi:ATP-binding protein [Halopseudomonas sp.]|uniref:ATP-binding protein n=1 Tax=Halopseudomonas sp. TaxID=2901191 RepID=UPI00300153E9
MKWLPSSLLGRNLLLLIALILAGQLLSALVLREWVQKPSVVRLSAILANNLLAVEAGLRNLPPEMRHKFVADFNHNSQRVQELLLQGQSVSPLPFPARRLLMQEVSKRLSTTQGGLVWRREAGDAFFVRLNIDGQNYWLATAGMQSGIHLSGAGIFSWVSGIVLAIIGAYLIQRRINKPLNDVALAARQLGQGETALWLPENNPREIAAVSRSFNQMQRQLQEQDKQRALMLAGVSHDLRTPLTKIRIAAELLVDEMGADAPATNPYRQTIAQSCADIESILRQFVDFAGIGNQETPAQVDINQLLTELEKAQSQRFTLRLRPLPLVRLRPQAVRRLLSNLLENAVRYGKGEFSIYSRREGEEIVVGICDQGPGIDPERVAEMLKPFTRGSASRHGVSGSGLGLAIAERIVRLEGGQLALLPADGGGLEAQVRLPI